MSRKSAVKSASTSPVYYNARPRCISCGGLVNKQVNIGGSDKPEKGYVTGLAWTILKASLGSKTVLTDVFLAKGKTERKMLYLVL
ncbi:hypothetical protein EJ110_NYTH45400 [Nymphaea thermarum]|nr:hypothetical protein EJ110_NYTH45400 [Nymphaea thermarum]